jgi:ATP-binding cassette, subfamily B, bacterial PglK
VRRLIKDVAYLVGREGWGRWVVVVVLGLGVALAEALAALGIVVLLALVVGTPGDLPLADRLLSQLGGTRDDVGLLGAAVIGSLFVGRAALVLAQTYFQNRIAYRAGAAVASRLLSGYLHMPYEWHLTRRSADLIRDASETTIQLVAYGLVPIAMLTADLILLSGMTAVLLVTAPVPTLFTALILGPVSFGLIRGLRASLSRGGEMHHRMASEGLQILQHSIGGIREVKVSGRTSWFSTRYFETRLGQARANYQRAAADELPRVSLETTIVLILIVYLYLREASAGGARAALPMLGVFAYSGLRMLPALNRVLTNVGRLRFGEAFASQLASDMRTTEEHQPPEVPTAALPFTDKISVAGASYLYPGSAEPALTGIDLEVRRGEQIGIAGPTGCGKTTLMDLMLGLLTPAEGSVAVDGVGLAGNEAGWHRILGVVPQDPFLANDSLRRNVALGLDDDEIDDSRVIECLAMAQLAHLPANLPGGLDCRLGDAGSRLSGGERQRVAIARALYRRPEVLFLDEGTSALDVETEARLIATLDEIRGGCTVVMIAHRLSTLRRCDRVIVLSRGRIEDVGTWDELARRRPEFASSA